MMLRAILLVCLLPVSAAAAPSFYLELGALTPAGEREVQLLAKDMPPIYGYEISMAVPSGLEVVDAVPGRHGVQVKGGEYFPGQPQVLRNEVNKQGMLQFAVSQLAPALDRSGDGVLLSFRIKAGSVSRGRFRLDRLVFGDSEGRAIRPPLDALWWEVDVDSGRVLSDDQKSGDILVWLLGTLISLSAMVVVPLWVRRHRRRRTVPA